MDNQQRQEPIACQNCDYFGFPCLNCAAYVFHGRLGPGFGHQCRRIMFTQHPEMPEDTRARMQEWITNHPNQDVTYEPFNKSKNNNNRSQR
jgi:hypothetical protein